MTNDQRMRITELRRQGCGYTAIANALGLSKDSVKAFCRNHGLAGVMAPNRASIQANPNACQNCGAPLTHLPGAKKKKFCCPTCRKAWWSAHPEYLKQKAIYSDTCPACGRPFTAYGNSHRKYCSHACYIADRFRGGDET